VPFVLSLRLFGLVLELSLGPAEEPEEEPGGAVSAAVERRDGFPFGFTTNDPAFPPLYWEEEEDE
jgi:hypothetical protein